MPQPFGVNLSFCVKRWVTPELWVPVVRDRLGLSLVQLSFDLVDPLWPEDVLADCAAALRRVGRDQGIEIHSAFIGLAHYTFNQLLHPDPKVRDHAETWLIRAGRFAAAAGILRIGGPLGAIAARPDGREAEAIPERDYADLVARMHTIAGAAREEGLAELYVEPTPLRREWPWSVGAGAAADAGCERVCGAVEVVPRLGACHVRAALRPVSGRHGAVVRGAGRADRDGPSATDRFPV